MNTLIRIKKIDKIRFLISISQIQHQFTQINQSQTKRGSILARQTIFFRYYINLQLKYIPIMRKKQSNRENLKHQQKSQQNKKKLHQNLNKKQIIKGELNTQYTNLLEQIVQSSYFNRLARHAKIKLQSWIQLLSKPQFNLSWKSNKLNYLKLLNLMCHCEYIISPFIYFPNQSFLPILQKHQINQIIDQVEKLVKKGKKSVENIPNKRSISNIQSQKYINSLQLQDLKDKFTNKLYRTKTTITIDQNSVHKKNDSLNKLIKNQKDFQQANTKYNSNSKTLSKEEYKQTKKSISFQVRNTLIHRNKRSQTSFFKCNDRNSIFDSIELFNHNSVSSQVWKYTHQPKNMRSQTMDLRKLLKDNSFKTRRQAQGSTLAFKVPLLDVISTENLVPNKKEYWESHSITGNVTPKYLNIINSVNNVAISEETDIMTNRSQFKNGCNCLQILLNNHEKQ